MLPSGETKETVNQSTMPFLSQISLDFMDIYLLVNVWKDNYAYKYFLSAIQVYKVVVNAGEHSWFIFRRYNEFHSLYDKVSPFLNVCKYLKNEQ